MCGIGGFSVGKSNLEFNKKILKMLDFLSHRGPDSSGYFQDSLVSLIHTRLSIIDIDGGKQPIENDGLVLIANGEIYNDLEIRKNAKNYEYVTSSDSESILALYKEFGLKGLDKLRGMYAFALYDKKNDQLILSRDEFGIKPLYFSRLEDGIIFSSEIQAIVKLKKKESKINEKKLKEFLQIQFCSQNETIYKDVFRIRPGEKLIIEKGKIKQSLLSNLLDIKKQKKPEVNEKFINEVLRDSIQVHQRSDVPYCLFFSGGIDSMLIMYFMSQLNLSKTMAFTLKFNEKENDFNDYTEYLSKRFNIEFLKITFDENDFWNLIPQAAKILDDPVADYAVLPTIKLAKEASKDFKVVITGEGGDEIFGGYGRYRLMTRPFFGRKKYFKGCFRQNNNSKNTLSGWNFDLDMLSERIATLPLSPLQKFQWFDYQNWLPNDLLIKLDRCLMAYGLEGRTPLIDKKVFQNFFFIPDKNKVKKGFGKFFIREFLNNKVDFYDPFRKKKGFTVPIDRWIPKKIDFLEKHLLKIDFLKKFFSKREILELCKLAKYDKKSVRALWNIIFFTIWYAVHVKKISPNGNFFEVIEQAK